MQRYGGGAPEPKHPIPVPCPPKPGVRKTQDRESEENLRKIGRHFVKTCEFEKSVVIGMSFMNELWNMMKTNKNFCMVLEYNAEAMNVEVSFFTDASDENLVEN